MLPIHRSHIPDLYLQLSVVMLLCLRSTTGSPISSANIATADRSCRCRYDLNTPSNDAVHIFRHTYIQWTRYRVKEYIRNSTPPCAHSSSPPLVPSGGTPRIQQQPPPQTAASIVDRNKRKLQLVILCRKFLLLLRLRYRRRRLMTISTVISRIAK